MYSTENFSADIVPCVQLTFVLGGFFMVYKFSDFMERFFNNHCYLILAICYVLIAYSHLTRGEIPPSKFNEAHSIAFAITYSPLIIIPMTLFYYYTR
jgi:hypothetical protein